MNLYFSSIGKLTYSKQEFYLNSSTNRPKKQYNSFVWFDVHENEITSIIKSLSSDKASGVDSICIRIIK